MIVKENSEMVSVHFDSMIDLMDFVPENPNNRDVFNEYINPRYDRYGNSKWLGGNTHKQIVEKALLGDTAVYKESMKRMKVLEADGEIKEKSQSVKKAKRIKCKSDMGDELDIHKVYQGNLSHAWSKTKRIEIDVKHHLVTLFITINGNCDIEFRDTIWRSAMILKLANEIQQAGKSVKIVVGGCVGSAMLNTNKLLTVSITVKKYNETLSPERLAAMTNIGFYRTFGFAAKECQNRTVHSSGGASTTIYKNTMPIHLHEEIEMGHTKPIFLSGVTSEYAAKSELGRAYRQMSQIA